MPEPTPSQPREDAVGKVDEAVREILNLGGSGLLNVQMLAFESSAPVIVARAYEALRAELSSWKATALELGAKNVNRVLLQLHQMQEKALREQRDWALRALKEEQILSEARRQGWLGQSELSAKQAVELGAALAQVKTLRTVLKRLAKPRISSNGIASCRVCGGSPIGDSSHDDRCIGNEIAALAAAPGLPTIEEMSGLVENWGLEPPGKVAP